jgi:beta-galactosidase
MLVIDENRLMGTNSEHLDMLRQMMLRDRNHPSVILWSLGNEEWAIENNIKGARISTTMQNYAQLLDSSRAFTVAVSGGWNNGSGMVAQVMGYNYLVQGDMNAHHAKFPWQAGVGTEETNTMGTRGIFRTNMAAGYLAPANRMPENVGTEYGWNYYLARPFLAGKRRAVSEQKKSWKKANDSERSPGMEGKILSGHIIGKRLHQWQGGYNW